LAADFGVTPVRPPAAAGGWIEAAAAELRTAVVTSQVDALVDEVVRSGATAWTPTRVRAAFQVAEFIPAEWLAAEHPDWDRHHARGWASAFREGWLREVAARADRAGHPTAAQLKDWFVEVVRRDFAGTRPGGLNTAARALDRAGGPARVNALELARAVYANGDTPVRAVDEAVTRALSKVTHQQVTALVRQVASLPPGRVTSDHFVEEHYRDYLRGVALSAARDLGGPVNPGWRGVLESVPPRR
jgi:hypothetical protein